MHPWLTTQSCYYHCNLLHYRGDISPPGPHSTNAEHDVESNTAGSSTTAAAASSSGTKSDSPSRAATGTTGTTGAGAAGVGGYSSAYPMKGSGAASQSPPPSYGTYVPPPPQEARRRASAARYMVVRFLVCMVCALDFELLYPSFVRDAAVENVYLRLLDISGQRAY
eukprot:20397-Heterococcus_DN1.PRE.4